MTASPWFKLAQHSLTSSSGSSSMLIQLYHNGPRTVQRAKFCISAKSAFLVCQSASIWNKSRRMLIASFRKYMLIAGEEGGVELVEMHIQICDALFELDDSLSRLFGTRHKEIMDVL